MPLCGSMLSTGVFQKTIFLVASLKVNHFFNNYILILQMVQSIESLHKREIKMCRQSNCIGLFCDR